MKLYFTKEAWLSNKANYSENIFEIENKIKQANIELFLKETEKNTVSFLIQKDRRNNDYY